MLIELALFVVAALYSSTGHGGGSGYLALFILAGTAAPDAAVMALTLNLLVAGMPLATFHRAGGAAPRLLLPLVVCSIPFAYLGGHVPLSGAAVAWIMAPALLIAGGLLAFRPIPKPRRVGWIPLLAVGSGLGYLAGVTGIGGGIYLTPILLMTGWASKNEAAWTSAAFILINSATGLLARAPALSSLPTLLDLAGVVVPVLLGGLLGSTWGAFKFSRVAFDRAMATLLALAAFKLLLAA